jgi:sialic acid synthase
MVRDIRLLERSLGRKELFMEPSVAAAKNKLERSIAAKRSIKGGEVITEDDLHMLSPGTGYRWVQRVDVVGRVAVREIGRDELVLPEHIKLVS